MSPSVNHVQDLCSASCKIDLLLPVLFQCIFLVDRQPKRERPVVNCPLQSPTTLVTSPSSLVTSLYLTYSIVMDALSGHALAHLWTFAHSIPFLTSPLDNFSFLAIQTAVKTSRPPWSLLHPSQAGLGPLLCVPYHLVLLISLVHVSYKIVRL